MLLLNLCGILFKCMLGLYIIGLKTYYLWLRDNSIVLCACVDISMHLCVFIQA